MGDFVGRKIRGYELKEMIGAGGFGVVYRAYQPAVEREVAIKSILPIHANDPEFVRRFEREARYIARLEHLHIIPIYDYWREPEGAYLVMRYLRGGNLLTSIQQDGPWALPDAARFIDQNASAQKISHRGGIVNQDLKPENILLDEEKNAYLSDFGIAKDIVAPSTEPPDRYGSPGYASPEQIIGQPVTPQSDIYSLSLVIYAMLTGEAPYDDVNTLRLIRKAIHEQLPWLSQKRSDLPHDLDRVLRRGAAKDPSYRYPDALSIAADFRRFSALSPAGVTQSAPLPVSSIGVSLETLPLDNVDTDAAQEMPLGLVTQPIDLSRNPYKGLRAFDEADSADFFGRDVLVKALVARMGEAGPYARFLAVVGPSGSGKSSVVRAGLLPALRRGYVTGSERWFVTTMVPGEHPLQELEEALLRVAFDPLKISLREAMNNDGHALTNALKQLFPADVSQVLLVIDQFEEVFSPAVGETEREQFLENLLIALRETDSRIQVVITLRADFYDRPLLHPGLGDLMRERTAVVLPLNDDELHEAIVNPAQNAGLLLEEGLAEKIIAEVREQPGGLPLLQFALAELYERRDMTQLTMSAYQSIGGVSGAMIQRADDLHKSLIHSKQVFVQQIFLRLVTLGEGVEDTRRRVLRQDLLSIGDKAVVEAVLQLFGRYRLLTFDHDPATRAPTVEIAHEALIRRWSKLRTWLESNRDSLRLQKRLEAAAAEWQNAERDPSFLASGSRLAQLESLLNEGTLALTNDERAYLESSIQLRQRNVRRLRLFMAVLVVITLVAVGLALFAIDRQYRETLARDEAETQADIARSRELAMAAVVERTPLAERLILSLQAVSSYDTAQARRSLLAGLQANPRLIGFLHGQMDRVRSVAVSPDGSLLATGGDDRQVVLYDAQTREPVGQPLAGHEGAVWSLAFSPDGLLLASAGHDGTVRLWDMDTRESRALRGHSGEVWSVAFSPDGRYLASGGADERVMLWDIQAELPQGMPLGGHKGIVYSVAFSPDGTLLASGDAGEQIVLHEMDNLETLTILHGHENWVLALAFSPDGTLLASSGPENDVVLWDVASRAELGKFRTNHTDWVRRIVFSPAGNLLATASQDNTVRLWDLTTIQLFSTPYIAHTDAVWDIAFNNDGSTFYTASSDGSAIVWSVNARQSLAQRLQGTWKTIWDVAFSPDGHWLAAGSGAPGAEEDAGLRLWRIENGLVTESATLKGFLGLVSSVAFSPDSRIVAAGSEDTTVRLWDIDIDPPASLGIFRQEASVLTVAFNPDGTYLAAGDEGGRITLLIKNDTRWELAGQQPSMQASGLTDLAFSPDGSVLAGGYRDQHVRLWNTRTWAQIGEPLAGHTDVVEALAFNADGTLLASAGRDNAIFLWDLTQNPPQRRLLSYHTNWVTGVAFSPEGRFLASSSRDNTVMLWDVQSGESFTVPLSGHTSWVSDVAFSPDGTRLASGSWDSSVILWDVSLQNWIKLACSISNPSTRQLELYPDVC